jgi:zinc finger CCHC domain-containing protein 8
MAFRSTRLPRLTLFSGPNCSLCDVRLLSDLKFFFSYPQIRPQSQLWPKSGYMCVILKSFFITNCPTQLISFQRDFQLDTINIQDPGQEKWKKKYVYWIPALHLDGKEIAKGRWDESVVLQALKEWDLTQQQQPQEETDKQN